MKKSLLLLLVVLLPFTACKKDKDDVEQLEFSVKNLSTLINKSTKYIKQASPGVFEEESAEDDFLMFMYDEDPQMGLSVIAYLFEENKCSFIDNMASEGTFEMLQYMMELTEDELGAAMDYALVYHEGINQYEETFTNYDDLWNYVEDSEIAEENVEVVMAIHAYNQVLVGVMGLSIDGEFESSISIMEQSVLKSTASMAETIKELKRRSKLK